MGIINITPDSFSDGSEFFNPEHAIARGRELVDEGADIIDIGAESSRPFAHPVTADEEMSRLKPVLLALRDLNIPISIDTYKPEVMREVIELGASMINDINALQAPGALDVVSGSGVAVCMMHKQNDPPTMQVNPSYSNVISEVKSFLQERVKAAIKHGIGRERLVCDPGFGFGKNINHNLELLRQLSVFKDLEIPILVGLSRKSMLGQITGKPVDERLYASIAAALLAVERGAQIVRVHDVAATKDALAVLNTVIKN